MLPALFVLVLKLCTWGWLRHYCVSTPCWFSSPLSLQPPLIHLYLSWRLYINLAAMDLKIHRRFDSFINVIRKRMQTFCPVITTAMERHTIKSRGLLSPAIHFCLFPETQTHSKTFIMVRLWGEFWMQTRSLGYVLKQENKSSYYVYVGFPLQKPSSLYAVLNHQILLACLTFSTEIVKTTASITTPYLNTGAI